MSLQIKYLLIPHLNIILIKKQYRRRRYCIYGRRALSLFTSHKLFRLTLPSSIPGEINAIELTEYLPYGGTGLACLDNGVGDLVLPKFDPIDVHDVDEITGQDILSRAKRGDFSWLLAQTIAANLNVNDYDIGYDIIRQAEELLCAYYVNPQDKTTWPFPDNRTVQQMATYLANVLDIYFNNLYRCVDTPGTENGQRPRR